MRDHNRVPLSLAIDPLEKDRIRRMARGRGLTMTRYLLALVHADEEDNPTKAERPLRQERPFLGEPNNAQQDYTDPAA